MERTAAIAQGAGIDYVLRTPAEVRAHLPQVLIRDCEIAGFEPTGGVVMCERAIEAQLDLGTCTGRNDQR